MKRITSKDLTRWATERDGQAHLPLLIRKLIKCQCPGILKMQFPAGDNISLSGWDGQLYSHEASFNIPSGHSVWEIGCRKDYKQKLDEDYCKRTAQPNGVDPEKTTYVGVTLYTYNDKDEWIAEKRKEGIWMDVQVIDALVLEEWIEDHPNVEGWLAKYLEKDADIIPLDDFWDNWKTSSQYSISPSLVLNGRESAKESLLSLLNESPSTIIIKSSTIEESIAFTAASISTSDPDTQFDFFSRTAIVENADDFKNVIVQRNPLILIAKFEDPGIIDKAIRNRHHVIVPCGFDTTITSDINIILPRIKRNGFEDALQEMGFSREEAEKHTRDSGQNLSVLRRRLQFVKNQMPEWAKKENFRDIIPALIAGSWDEQNDADKEMIALIAGTSYEEYITRLSKWILYKDAPILYVRSIWRLTSSLDAWSVLGRSVVKRDLEALESAIVEVFKEHDPAMDMEPDQRYLASTYRKTPRYSRSLKEGLLNSLTQISVFGESFEVTVIDSPQYFADAIVRKVLQNATEKKWCSLNYYLPLLSEASPMAFLEEVKESLDSNEKNILEVFKEAKGVFTPTSYHTGLLWALENLAASPLYILRASLLLAQLAKHDPGGSTTNRPLNSLSEIYVPWFVQTEASFELRKTVLRRLSQDYSDIGWALFIKLLPDNHAIAHPIHKCNWRFNTQSLMSNPTYGEIWDFYAFLFDQLLILTDKKAEKVKSLIKRCHNYGEKERRELFAFLKENATSITGDRFLLWGDMKKFIEHHRSYLDCDWALTEGELDELQEICNLFDPESTILKNAHLFEESWYQLPGVKRRDMSDEKNQQLLLRIRTSALSSIYNSYGLDGLFQLAEKAAKGSVVGTYCAEISLTEKDEHTLLGILETDLTEKLKQEFIQSYIPTKAIKAGRAWIESTWKFIDKQFSSPENKAGFLVHLPQQTDTWKLFESNPEIKALYWEQVYPWMYRMTTEERIYAIAELQRVNRHRTVLNNAAHFAEELDPSLVAEILLNAATQPCENSVLIKEYDVSQLFKAIYKNEKIDKNKMIQLEWLYIDFVTSSYAHYKPYHLLKALTDDPSFFVDVVDLVHMRDDENLEQILSDEELTKKYKMANSARSLLESWTDIPGMNEEKVIDENKLFEWVNTARTLAKAKKIARGVDSQLGKLFAWYPRNNELWPCEAICNVIEAVNTETLTDSFRTEIFNSRGIYSKSPYEGGDQERRLSDYFGGMARKLNARWPITASVLDGLAKSYIRDAKREDDSARLDELYR